MKKYLTKFLALSLMLILPNLVFGAVTVGSTEASNAGHRVSGTGVQLTWSFNNVAGTYLVCHFEATGTSGSSAISVAPTYNGVTMTQIGTVSWDTNRALHRIYGLVAPATGSNAVAITATGGGTFATLGGCDSFLGVDQTTPAGTATTGTGTTGTTATAGAITAAATSYISASGGWGSGAGGAAGGSFTLSFKLNGSGSTSGDDILGEYIAGTGGSITPTFTWTNSDLWGIVAVEIKASASASTAGNSVNISQIGTDIAQVGVNISMP